MKKRDYIFNKLREHGGAEEGAKLTLCTDVATGETTVIVEKTIIERYKVQELDKAEDLYERLTCASGRKRVTLNEIAHPYNPN